MRAEKICLNTFSALRDTEKAKRSSIVEQQEGN